MWFRVITTFVVLVLMRTSLCRGESCKGRYFTISDDKLTQSAASTSCGNYKAGKLASVPDGETQGELVKLANQRTWDPYIWLGGKRASASSDFLWPGGIKVSSSGYNQWPGGKAQGSGHCMLLAGTSGTFGYTWLWGDSFCTANRYYLCQYNDTRSISIDSPSYRVQLGGSVTITGKITGLYNEPLTIIANFTSGEVIVATGVITTTFSYTISSAIRSQFTTIRFVAKGASCVTSEATTVLLENAPASISLSSSNIVVNYNVLQTVDCTSSGKPTPQITWYRNNVAVKTTSPGIYQGSQTGSGTVDRRLYLTLTNVVDSGSYVCKVAANVAGPLRQLTLTVRVPADIALSSTIVNLDYKQVKTVDCTSKGNPRPSVTWKRNGVAVTSAISNDIHQSITYPSSLQAKSRLSLKITNANQGGDYTCDASNTGGTRTSTLTVRVAPSAFLSVASIAAEYATPYQADCYSYGFPKPSITWKRFGDPVTSATNQPIYTTSIETSNPLEARARVNFRFSNVGQSGVYVCEASNVVKTTSVSLGITMPVNISVSSTKLELDYNETQTVDCQSFGYPKPQVFWQRNGANVTTATTSEVFQTVTHVSDSQIRSRLTFKVTSAHHSGSYTCTATNTVTTTKKTSAISVSIAPNVQLSYAQVAANYTQQYPIDCNAAGWPKPTVTWKRNGNPVTSGTGAAVYQETVSSSSSLSSTVRLFLKLDSIEQAGDYVCEANNEVLTRNKTFKVLVASNVSLTQTTVKTDYRQNQTVVCTSYGYPKPSVTWKRNGAVVSTIPSNIHQSHVVTEAYKSTQKLHLRITNVSESGNYTCEVEANSAGGMKTATALLQVYPNAELTANNVSVNYSQLTSVVCKAYGFPRPTIMWKRKNIIVSNNEGAVVNTSVIDMKEYLVENRIYLKVNTISEADSYICVASNSAGTKEVSLTVNVFANVSVSVTSRVMEEGKIYQIDCVSFGFPTPITKWTRKGSEVSTVVSSVYQTRTTTTYKSTSALSISYNAIVQAGAYVCGASNLNLQAQQATFQANVKVNISLSTTSLTYIEGSRSKVTCISFGFPAPTVHWARDSANITTHSNMSIYQEVTSHQIFKVEVTLHVTKLKVTDSGGYVCHTDNIAGKTSATANIQVAPYIEQSNATARFQQTQSFSCAFSSDSAPNVHWSVNNGPITEADTSLTEISTHSTETQTISRLTTHSSIIYGQNASVQCWAVNLLGQSKKNMQLMNKDLRIQQKQYYTHHNQSMSYEAASKHCTEAGGWLPTIAFLNSTKWAPKLSGVMQMWAQSTANITTDGNESTCTVMTLIVNITTDQTGFINTNCSTPQQHVCLFSDTQILETSNCYSDRITLTWKDTTSNKGNITYLVKANRNQNDITVKNTQQSTSNHMYTNVVNGLVADKSYLLSVSLFPDVSKLTGSTATITAQTSSIFQNVTGKMVTWSETYCNVTITVPQSALVHVSAVKIRFKETLTSAFNRTNRTAIPELNIKASGIIQHQLNLVEGQVIKATFIPVTSTCKNPVLDVIGECKVVREAQPTPSGNGGGGGGGKEEGGGTTVGLAVGISVLILVVFAMVAGFLIYTKRMGTWKLQRLSNDLNRVHVERQEGEYVSPLNKINTMERTQITAEELEEFYRSSLCSEHAKLKEQFNKIKQITKGFATSFYKDSKVSLQNRYRNIIPYDHNMVKLQANTDDGNTYINASEVEGYMQPGKWICTQGPLPNTTDDFWTMVWQQNIRTIVMLANVYENFKAKCALYWPTVGGSRFGTIEVSLSEVIHRGCYVIRKFSVVQTDTTYLLQARNVTQFHFVGWPDHGVPTTTTGLLRFAQNVNKTMEEVAQEIIPNPPTIVHCSAGVGRTGTFVGLDYLKEQMKQTGSVDFFQAVYHMRQQRIDMVQTNSQYIFLHKLLNETNIFEDTDANTEKVKEKIKEMEGDPIDSKINTEFQNLDRLFDKEEMSRVVIENSQVSYKSTLTTIPEMGAWEGYNAYSVQSYNNGEKIIIAGEPTIETAEEFWRLALETNTKVVVALDQPENSSFWPEKLENEVQQESIIVTMTEQREDNCAEFEAKLPEGEGQVKVIRTEFMSWSDEVTPTRHNELLEFFDLMDALKKKGGAGAKLLYCRGGFSKAVFMCAVWNLIERYKTENMIDVFRTVKDIGDAMPELGLSLEQYKGCYHVIMSYVEARAAYVNNSYLGGAIEEANEDDGEFSYEEEDMSLFAGESTEEELDLNQMVEEDMKLSKDIEAQV